MHDISSIAGEYSAYLKRLSGTLGEGERQSRTLAGLIESSPAIHLYGFGRSGTAGLAMAIRLRHFLAPEQQVFWLGDQVRDPIRKNDVVILFSKSGNRREVICSLESARDAGARCVAITSDSASPLARGSFLTIILPPMDGGVIYGGGDFELAAWYFQEIFVTWYGRLHGIPPERVGERHI